MEYPAYVFYRHQFGGDIEYAGRDEHTFPLNELITFHEPEFFNVTDADSLPFLECNAG